MLTTYLFLLCYIQFLDVFCRFPRTGDRLVHRRVENPSFSFQDPSGLHSAERGVHRFPRGAGDRRRRLHLRHPPHYPRKRCKCVWSSTVSILGSILCPVFMLLLQYYLSGCTRQPCFVNVTLIAFLLPNFSLSGGRRELSDVGVDRERGADPSDELHLFLHRQRALWAGEPPHRHTGKLIKWNTTNIF